MRMHPLGESGIEASVVGLGAYAIGGWQWGGVREKDAAETIHAAIDNGVTLIDTAPIYGLGRSEEILGRALSGGRRHQVVLASKCGLVWDESEKGGSYAFSTGNDAIVPDSDPGSLYRVYRNNRPSSIRREVEQSLRRLRTDYLDLIQTHWQDAATPVEVTMAELMKLKKEGKIRAIGCCNATPEEMERYRSAGQLDADQEKFSMLDMEREKDNLPYCRENSMAFLAYSPLAQGLLTGAVGPERHFAPGDARAAKPRFNLDGRQRVADFLKRIHPIADDHRLTLAQAVAAWTLEQPGCTHVLMGARSIAQATENAKAGAAQLDTRSVQAVTEIVRQELTTED